MKKDKTREIFDRLRLKYDYSKFQTEDSLAHMVGLMVSEARSLRGYTQEELAELMGTHQPGIARIENGSGLPSMSFLHKMAKALGSSLIPPYFAFMAPKSVFYRTFIVNSSNTTTKDSDSGWENYLKEAAISAVHNGFRTELKAVGAVQYNIKSDSSNLEFTQITL